MRTAARRLADSTLQKKYGKDKFGRDTGRDEKPDAEERESSRRSRKR